MSVRVIGTRLFNHGTLLVRSIIKKEVHQTRNIADKINAAKQVPSNPSGGFNNNQLGSRYSGLRNVGVQLGLQARRILIDNVLNRVTNSLMSEMRKKAARR